MHSIAWDKASLHNFVIKKIKMSKILVIENSRSVRMDVVNLLKKKGYEVIEAENGRLGIDSAKKYLPDLIISDVSLPEIDGYEVIRELKKEIATSSIPFILLTVKEGQSKVSYKINPDSDDNLNKPYKTTDLISVIEYRLKPKNYIDKKVENLNKSIAKSLPHELRSPLIAVNNLSKTIIEKYSGSNRDEILDLVGKINEAGYNLYKVFQKFLLFSEIEIINTDKEQLKALHNLPPIHAEKLIRSTAFEVLTEYGRDGDLNINLQEAHLFMENEHMKFIIEELLDNACKYSEKGTQIILNSRIEKDNYVIEIIDYGRGLGYDDIKEIGLPKQFGVDILSRNGFGLGLTVVRKLVSLYNGEFELTGEKNNYIKIKISFNIKMKIS